VAWHRDNNAGDNLIFHIGHAEIKATMSEWISAKNAK
jgi:hypothetical protein